MIEALEFWGKIAEWPESEKAVQFYNGCGFSKDDVLRRGTANFDVRVTEEFKCAAEVIDKEKSHYRIAYYVNKDKGYMDMHIKQNLAIFKKCLKGIQEDAKSILFVDFGCGPMTSGFALADVLSRAYKTDDYKKYVSYHGRDISKNMARFAKRINDKYDLFAPDRFSVARAKDLRLSNVLARSPQPAMPQLAILCLSFVFAPRTLKMAKQDVEELARQWDGFVRSLPECAETRIIYVNSMKRNKDPNVPTCWPHQNWHFFRAVLKELSNHGRDMIYSSGSVRSYEWGGHKPCSMAMIKGKRRK